MKEEATKRVSERLLLEAIKDEEKIEVSDDELREAVTSVLKAYLQEKMGGVEEKSERFMKLFYRLVDISMSVIERLKVEFGVGEFAPCDFELRIGGSDIPDYAYTINDYTEVLHEFLESLNINDPILIGHSFGGRIAINYDERMGLMIFSTKN